MMLHEIASTESNEKKIDKKNKQTIKPFTYFSECFAEIVR